MSSRKKVLVRTLADTVHAGYLPLSGILSAPLNSAAEVGPTLDLLDLSGRILPLPLAQVKTIAYVRDFNLHDPLNPENLQRRAFLARPRTEGLWLRLTFLSGDTLEGLAPLDLALLDSAITDLGLSLLPPDIRANTQRLFVPRTAIGHLQLLAVITTPSKPKPAPPSTPHDPELPFPPP